MPMSMNKALHAKGVARWNQGSSAPLERIAARMGPKKKTRVEQIQDTILNNPKKSFAIGCAAVLGAALIYGKGKSLFDPPPPCALSDDLSKCSPEAAYAKFKNEDPQSAFFLARKCIGYQYD